MQMKYQVDCALHHTHNNGHLPDKPALPMQFPLEQQPPISIGSHPKHPFESPSTESHQDLETRRSDFEQELPCLKSVMRYLSSISGSHKKKLASYDESKVYLTQQTVVQTADATYQLSIRWSPLTTASH